MHNIATVCKKAFSAIKHEKIPKVVGSLHKSSVLKLKKSAIYWSQKQN